jgi:stress-induced morphogen
MNANEVAELIESGLDDADVTVSQPRGVHDEDHLAATVVSPAFDGKTLVEQHQMVYDTLGDHMTTDIHALELKTYTPDEYDGR